MWVSRTTGPTLATSTIPTTSVNQVTTTISIPPTDNPDPLCPTVGVTHTVDRSLGEFFVRAKNGDGQDHEIHEEECPHCKVRHGEVNHALGRRGEADVVIYGYDHSKGNPGQDEGDRVDVEEADPRYTLLQPIVNPSLKKIIYSEISGWQHNSLDGKSLKRTLLL